MSFEPNDDKAAWCPSFEVRRWREVLTPPYRSDLKALSSIMPLRQHEHARSETNFTGVGDL